MSADDRRAIDQARLRADLSVDQLWLRYFELGGVAGLVEVEAFLQRLMPLSGYQHDVLVHAVNERLVEVGLVGDLPYLLSA